MIGQNGKFHKIYAERDSVCMSDDCHAPNAEELDYRDGDRLSDFMDAVAKYVPAMKNVVWGVACAGEMIAYLYFDEASSYEYELQVKDIKVSELLEKKIHCTYYCERERYAYRGDLRGIQKADFEDLQEILQLQYLSYQSEANLFENRNIPPLNQTLDELIDEYNTGVILKMRGSDGNIIGSVRAKKDNRTVYIGKLMVHPRHRRCGYGAVLLKEVEGYFPGKRYELFTSTRSESNIRFYQRMGYKILKREVIDDELQFVYLEKDLLP